MEESDVVLVKAEQSACVLPMIETEVRRIVNIVSMMVAVESHVDIIEEMNDVSAAKEVVRNLYTNLALVSALLLTVAFATATLESSVLKYISNGRASCSKKSANALRSLRIRKESTIG